MPIYEYTCKDCGHQFDSLRSMRDADRSIACKHCQSMNTHRKISVFFAHSDGRSITTTNNSSCSGCSGGSCASCHN